MTKYGYLYIQDNFKRHHNRFLRVNPLINLLDILIFKVKLCAKIENNVYFRFLRKKYDTPY
jgi:hypothetical protein